MRTLTSLGSSKPVMLIEVLGTTIVLSGVLLMGTGWATEYAEMQMVDLRADRVASAGMALDVMDQGMVEIDLGEYYNYSYDEERELFFLNYRREPDSDAVVEANTSFSYVEQGYDSLRIPEEYSYVNGSLLLIKTSDGDSDVLRITDGDPDEFDIENYRGED